MSLRSLVPGAALRPRHALGLCSEVVDPNGWPVYGGNDDHTLYTTLDELLQQHVPPYLHE